MSSEAKNVAITLTTVIHDQGEQEQFEVKARGRLYIRQSRYVLQFTSHEMDEPTNNIYTIQDDAVSIKRSGAIDMFQKFQKQKRTENVYRHPHGNIHMETMTNELIHLTSDNVGRLQIAYEVKLNGQEGRNHTLQLVYKEEK